MPTRAREEGWKLFTTREEVRREKRIILLKILTSFVGVFIVIIILLSLMKI